MRRDTFLSFAIILLTLAALAAKSLLMSLPPVQNASGHFNAQRAKARLAFVLGSQQPHPADSAADDAVRARIVTTLQQMGLKPIVRDQFACNDFAKARLVTCARVRNVIAMLGPSSGKTLLLSAHYDSVPVGPGASDDGIGVATLLEVGSILKDRPLRRPVILLFNEGEELGLVGARAFLTDPLSRNVDSLLNFEARGVTGPATMFETNQPNGAAIAAFAGAVRQPYASSLSTDVARLIPNDTDVTAYKERGWTTLNFAIVGNETRYHSPGDDLAALDTRSLQHMGDQALSLTEALSAGVPHAQGTRIFIDVFQRIFLNIPLAVGLVWFVLLLALFAAIAWRRGALIPAALVILGALVASGAAAWVGLAIMDALRAGIYWRAHPEITFVAAYATALLGALIVVATAGAKVPTERLRPAYWVLFLLLGGAMALAAPGGIIYFLIPPTIALIGIGLARRYRNAETIGALVAVAALYLTWSELLIALEELFSPGPLWVVTPIAAIMILAVLVEAHSIFIRAQRAVLLLGSAAIALIAWAVVAMTPAYSADRQQRLTVEHLTEFPSGRSFWSVLNDGAALPKGYQAVGQWHFGKLPFSERRRWLAPAPQAVGIQPASLQLIDSLVSGSERRLRVRLKANGAERIAIVAPPEAHIQSAGAAGFVRSIGDDDSDGNFTISCTGRSCDGAELMVDLISAKPVAVTIIGSRNGVPAAAAPLLRARPPFARPQYTPDETVTVEHVKL